MTDTAAPQPALNRAPINIEGSQREWMTTKEATMQKVTRRHKHATETPPQQEAEQHMVEQPKEQPYIGEMPEVSPQTICKVAPRQKPQPKTTTQ